MAQRNEDVDMLMEELERHGLRGELGERGKHLEIAWNAPAGRRFIIIAKTPSDWRGSMNSRSDMRKLLRADGLQPKPISELSFQKAMSLPKPVAITKELLLQKDVDTLTDLVFEMQGQIDSMKQYIGEALREQLAAMTVTSKVSFGDAEFEAALKHDTDLIAKVVLPLKAKRGTKTDLVWSLLSSQFKEKRWLVEQSGIESNHLNSILQKFRRDGKVENGLRGQWRRIV